MCDNRRSNEISSIEGTHQLIDSVAVKQEPDIKEEPRSEVHLEEFPAFDNHNNDRTFVDCGPSGSGSGLVNSTANDVKVEVKEEPDGRNEKEPRPPNPSLNDNAMSNQQGHALNCRARGPKFNQNRNTARNANKASNARGGEQNQHQCGQCEYTTKNIHNLMRHLLKHTGEKLFPCDRCAKAFKQKSHLMNHMRVHINEFLFHCSICLKGFDQKNEKKEHEINCKYIRYECHLCKKSFGLNKPYLITHMCVHSGEQSFECTECLKQFSLEGSLKRHMELHAGPRPFRCLKCRQGFLHEDEMIAHQQQCSRRMYECYVCGKFFGSNKAHLEQHMRTHTGDKPFQCTQCPKKFSLKSTLDRHLKIHSRSLPWKCAICRQGFKKQFQWKAHQRNCTRRMYECHLCKKFFGSRSSNLKTHMTKHSGEKPFECGMCRNRFTDKGNLTQHMKRIHNESR